MGDRDAARRTTPGVRALKGVELGGERKFICFCFFTPT